MSLGQENFFIKRMNHELVNGIRSERKREIIPEYQQLMDGMLFDKTLKQKVQERAVARAAI